MWATTSFLGIAMPSHLSPAPFGEPTTVDGFRERLIAVTDTLPKRLRQCADYVAQNLDRIAVSTVADIAAGADVPPSAVIRFCQLLGFSGYSDMQRLFRDAYSPGWPNYATRLENLKSGPSGSPTALVAEFVEAGRLSLEKLVQSLDETVLDQAVSILTSAGTIHVVGFRRAYPVASYLAYVLAKMEVPAILHHGAGHLDQRFALRPGDAMLAISFAPYSQETLALAEAAQTAGLAVVGLTDTVTSPLSRSATTLLTVTEVDFGAFRSLSATIALAISLAVAVGTARR